VSNVLISLHYYNVVLILLTTLVSGIWGLVLYFRKRDMIRPWRIMLIATLADGLLQGLIGVTMVLMNLKPGGGVGNYYLHYVYGGIVALGIPIVWVSFTANEKNQRRAVLFYSIATIFMAAAAVRAYMTGV